MMTSLKNRGKDSKHFDRLDSIPMTGGAAVLGKISYIFLPLDGVTVILRYIFFKFKFFSYNFFIFKVTQEYKLEIKNITPSLKKVAEKAFHNFPSVF